MESQAHDILPPCGITDGRPRLLNTALLACMLALCPSLPPSPPPLSTTEITVISAARSVQHVTAGGNKGKHFSASLLTLWGRCAQERSFSGAAASLATKELITPPRHTHTERTLFSWSQQRGTRSSETSFKSCLFVCLSVCLVSRINSSCWFTG